MGASMDRPLTYQIQVEGRLDESWAECFGGMKITFERGDGGPITTLTGSVIDQSALHGILAKLGYLNLTLISVARIERDAK